MKILLDENFPLPLYYRLREVRCDVEHIIVLGQRGVPDSAIRERLAREELVFLTNDTEFGELRIENRTKVIISRVPQNLPTAQRVEVWFKALAEFMADMPSGQLFDLLETGQILPWEIRETE